jgi:hypothetical protein
VWRRLDGASGATDFDPPAQTRAWRIDALGQIVAGKGEKYEYQL